MLLQRLRSGNTLCNVGEVYGLVESIILSIVRNFYKLVRVHLQKIFVQVPSLVRFRFLAQKFEALHGIAYIIGTIDGSHILILAPVFGRENWIISFHLVLIQGILDTKYVF